MRKKAVAFDMDGTLYSSEPLIEKVYADSIHEYNQTYQKNLIPPTFKQIEKMIGQPVKDIYLGLFKGITESEMNQLGRIIGREFTKSIEKQGGILFEGVKEVFDYLTENGYNILLASNGKREYLKSIIQKFNLKIEPFVCVGENGIENKGQILRYYLDFYHLPPQDLIMVGDRDSDFNAAKEVGCYFVGCDFGHGESYEIECADKLISELIQLKDIIKELCR